MKIYVPTSQECPQLAHPTNSEDYDTINALVNGESRADTWNQLEFELVDHDEGVDLTTVDAPWLGSHALIFKPAAVLALRSILEAHGELLPLSSKNSKLWVFNATHVTNALDASSSEVTRFSSGRIMRITRYMFFPEKIAGHDIFKIPDLRVSPTFVSEKVVGLFREHGLTGIEFTPVWGRESNAA